uniref:Uncharacterized protein n=1 Tax=Chelonoidis abingdonii TaxID=106734 RepID=A0A8C0FVP9_CHEAB
MSCSSLCYPECGVARPSPVSSSCNEPCVSSALTLNDHPTTTGCRDHPGPISALSLSRGEVGTVGAPVVGSGYGGSFGLGGLYGYGCPYGGLGLRGPLWLWGGYGELWLRRGYGYGGLCGSAGRLRRIVYLSGSCTPC